MKTKTMLLAATMTALLGCQGTDEGDWAVRSFALTAEDEAGLLGFLNDPETTFERLDDVCEIRSDSARQIIKHRNGKDKTYGTDDDDPFDTLAELMDVAMVGDWTRDRLVDCARTFGFLAPDPGCAPLEYEDHESYDFEERYYHQLDPTLAALVDELEPDAAGYADPEIIFPMEFSHVEVYSLGGVPQVYMIRYRQWLDPECGVLLWVEYTVDSCFNVVSVYVYV